MTDKLDVQAPAAGTLPCLSRRRLLATGVAVPLAAGAAVVRQEIPWQEGRADAPKAALQAPPAEPRYSFFQPAEAAFIEAAVARLIPKDDLGPGFIDRQLTGPYGQGQRWYMQGPWGEGLPTQGYQSRQAPAALYRAAIAELDREVGRQHGGSHFAALAAADEDRWLKTLEDGKVELPTVDAKAFFQQLHQNTLEGFWADPIYGGNRDMAGWRLIGFAGARYDHRPYVSKHGERYPLQPTGGPG